MWKIGPEWAAQQAKYASAMAANWGVRRACQTVSSRPSAPRIPGAPAATAPDGSRTSRAAGMMTSQARLPITNIAVRQS
jgi:hypothetical protein